MSLQTLFRMWMLTILLFFAFIIGLLIYTKSMRDSIAERPFQFEAVSCSTTTGESK